VWTDVTLLLVVEGVAHGGTGTPGVFVDLDQISSKNAQRRR